MVRISFLCYAKIIKLLVLYKVYSDWILIHNYKFMIFSIFLNENIKLFNFLIENFIFTTQI